MSSDDVRSVFEMLALPLPAFVRCAYRNLLGRPPGAPELKVRMSALRGGQGRRRLLADIVESTEYRARRDQAQRGESDEAFVTRMYRDYLDRTPDDRGMATYRGLLRAGKNRESIGRTIATSREAREAGTFWFELDLVLLDQRRDRSIFRRWVGRARRLERRCHQDVEIANRGRGARAGRNEATAADPFADEGMRSDDAVSLTMVDPTPLSRDARRMLQRFRHFSGDIAPPADLD